MNKMDDICYIGLSILFTPILLLTKIILITIFNIAYFFVWLYRWTWDLL